MKFTIKSVKANFFDRTSVIRAVGKARAKIMSKAGAYIRYTAHASIRKAPKASGGPQGRDVEGHFLKVARKTTASAPGSPPYSRTGLLKKHIAFAYDRTTQTEVIGPTLINKPTGAPETLEYGGEATVEEARVVSGPKYGNRTQKITTARKIKVAARPYMGPALKAEAPNFADLWRNSVR